MEAKTLTVEQALRISESNGAWEEWESAYDRALRADKKAGRPYDRHKYARFAHAARMRAMLAEAV